MKEALLYKKLKGQKVSCQLCSHRCLIRPGQKGICFVRENKNGTLYSLVYGLTLAANVDPIEKKPLFHFLPGTLSFSIATAGCNFRCAFCQNWSESQITKGSSGRIIGRKISPKEIVKQAQITGCQSIAYTYTEPTIFFEYARDTALLARKKGLANIFVTNGFQTPETIKEMAKFVDAANVDLKSFSDKFYQKVCGARLKPVMESIKLLHQAKIWLEITTLVVPKQNDSSKELKQMARFISSVDKNIPWHLSRFHPNYKMTTLKPTPMKTLEKAYQIGKKEGLKYVYLGNVISNKENTHCPKCNQLLIQRSGYTVKIRNIDQKGRCRNCQENINLRI